jgi:hypothetical protein
MSIEFLVLSIELSIICQRQIIDINTRPQQLINLKINILTNDTPLKTHNS